MIDPITSYKYPEEWVARCHNPMDLALVSYGLAILTSDGKVLKRGFTTGTTAAAVCKASIMSLGGAELSAVNIRLACGMVCPVEVRAKNGQSSCYKYSGDYPNDATAGIEFKAHFVEFKDEVELDIGKGIGVWDRDTPRYDRGAPAISGTAMNCIIESISTACLARGRKGALVHLEAVNGKKVALNTLNSKIGVVDGISVLGSTGLVEPWDDHLGKDSIERARSAERAVVTTGRVGLRHARLQFPDREVVLVGANIDAALRSRDSGLTLFGLPALIIKFIDPDILKGRKFGSVEELVFSEDGARIVHASVVKFKCRFPGHGIMIIDRNGDVLEAAD